MAHVLCSTVEAVTTLGNKLVFDISDKKARIVPSKTQSLQEPLLRKYTSTQKVFLSTHISQKKL